MRNPFLIQPLPDESLTQSHSVAKHSLVIFFAMIHRFAIYEQSKCVRCGSNRHNWFTSFSWWMVAATNRTAIHFHCNSILLHSLNCPIMRIFSCAIFLCPTDRPTNQPTKRPLDRHNFHSAMQLSQKAYIATQSTNSNLLCNYGTAKKKGRDKATEECHGKNVCLSLRKKFIMCADYVKCVRRWN